MAYVNTVAGTSTATSKVYLTVPRKYLLTHPGFAAAKSTPPTTGQTWPRRGA